MKLRAHLVHALGFGLFYSAAVLLGLQFGQNGIAFFWPASGVACAFFILSSKRRWPTYIAGFIPAYCYPLVLSEQHSLFFVAALCAANLIQAVAAGVLVQRFIDRKVDVSRLRLLSKFIFFATLIPPLLSSAIGVPLLFQEFGQLQWQEYFLFWVIGNSTGILPTAIFLSVISTNKLNIRKLLKSPRIRECLIYTLLFSSLAIWASSHPENTSFLTKDLPHLILPALLYSSIRFGAQFTSAVMLFYTSIAAYFSAQELGPFFDTDVPFLHNIIAFDIYIISLTITCLVVAAIKHDLDLIQGQLKREKRQAEHLNQLKTQFIANVNHEIRTPVTGVVGASNLLRETNINSDQQRLLDVIDESSNHLLTLINDVLDFSKQESDKIELENTFVDIEELLKGVTRSFVAQAENKGVDLLVDCNPALSNYLGDPTAIGQILRNLVSNALKFTDTGHIAITASSMANGLKLTIQDTGIGISEDQQKIIFQVHKNSLFIILEIQL